MSEKESSGPRQRAYVGIDRENIENQGALVMSEEVFAPYEEDAVVGMSDEELTRAARQAFRSPAVGDL